MRESCTRIAPVRTNSPRTEENANRVRTRRMGERDQRVDFKGVPSGFGSRRRELGGEEWMCCCELEGVKKVGGRVGDRARATRDERGRGERRREEEWRVRRSRGDLADVSPCLARGSMSGREEGREGGRWG